MWIAIGVGALLLWVLLSPDEDKKRNETPCCFTDSLSQVDFETIVRKACKPVKRLKLLEIDGALVKCSVRTSSGISKWKFSLDFNDYGHLTGRYWLHSGNDKSTIPGNVASEISEEIKSRLPVVPE